MAHSNPNSILLFDGEKLKLEASTQAQRVTIKIQGTLDEDMNSFVLLTFLSEQDPRPDEIRFDLSGVDRMNSCGVREWLLFMEKLRPAGELIFEALSGAFVSQANIIHGLLGRGVPKIESFKAPYYCSQCNAGSWVLMKPAQIKFQGSVPQLPTPKCQRCSGPLEFDSLAEEYFSFLIPSDSPEIS